jgi:hypothetical protein
MAGDLGLSEIEQEFLARSEGWRHLLDPDTGFLRPRRLHYRAEPFDPRRADRHYAGVAGALYGFFVPHDVPGLIAASGGDDRFVQRLDELFAAGGYDHRAPPGHHVAWLYHYAGRPDLGAARARRILDELYGAGPDGLAGNDLGGQLSSWYVLAAAGLYPADACSDEYALGSPIFDAVTIRPDGGRRFAIRARRDREGGEQVRAVELNGEGLRRSFVRHGEIVAGGGLSLELGRDPGTEWGRAPADRPGTPAAEQRVLPAPFVRGVRESFRGEASIELVCADPRAEIRYEILPAPPDELGWQTYDGPLQVGTSARLRFRAERDGRRSPTIETFLYRVPHDWTVELAHEPGPENAAGGPDALIDGLRGAEDWRKGGWHGYEGGDLEATLDLGASRVLRRAGASFLQDVDSSIWMPSEMTVSVSADGERFEEVARWSCDVPEDERGIVLREVAGEFEGLAARWVRIFARNRGTVPDWHPESGAPARLFVDEILIEED